jgi:hypothetical protein
VPKKPPNPTGPRVPSGDPRREPATIDLTATELRAHAPQADAGSHDPSQSEFVAPSLRPEPLGDEAPAEPATTAEQAQPTPTPDEVIPSDDISSRAEASAEASVPLGAPVEAPRRGTGFGALLAASLLGGIIGAGAMMVAEPWWGPLASRSDARPPTTEQRAAPAPSPDTLGPLERRIAALEAESKLAVERLRAAQALAERSAQQAEAALNRSLPATTPAPAPDNAADAAAVNDLAARLSALETQARERAQATSALQESVQAGTNAAQTNASAVQALERRLAEQDQRLGAVTRQLSERSPDAASAPSRVVIAQRVADALREGAPLGQLLALLRRLQVKPDNLQPLEPFAQRGAPTPAALGQEFKPLGRRIIAETRPAPSDWNDRLWSVLGKVVTVRAVSEPRGTDPASLVARIETALANNAVIDAAAAWDALPDAARRVAPEWGEKLKQRAAAEAAAQRISTEAVSALEASAR